MASKTRNGVPDGFREVISEFIEVGNLARTLDEREALIQKFSQHLVTELEYLCAAPSPGVTSGPARDYDFHGNPPNLPASTEFAEVGNWLGEICGNCSEERREHAANGDGCLNAAGTMFEPTGKYTPPARPELDKDEGGS